LPGHPLDDVLGALVVTPDRVVADQLEVDVPVAQRHAGMVAHGVAGLGDRGDEPCAAGEVAGEEAGVEPLTHLAPVGQVGLGDLLAGEHVHAATVVPAPDVRRPECAYVSAP
jgi:hypothetical protein